MVTEVIRQLCNTTNHYEISRSVEFAGFKGRTIGGRRYGCSPIRPSIDLWRLSNLHICDGTAGHFTYMHGDGIGANTTHSSPISSLCQPLFELQWRI